MDELKRVWIKEMEIVVSWTYRQYETVWADLYLARARMMGIVGVGVLIHRVLAFLILPECDASNACELLVEVILHLENVSSAL